MIDIRQIFWAGLGRSKKVGAAVRSTLPSRSRIRAALIAVKECPWFYVLLLSLPLSFFVVIQPYIWVEIAKTTEASDFVWFKTIGLVGGVLIWAMIILKYGGEWVGGDGRIQTYLRDYAESYHRQHILLAILIPVLFYGPYPFLIGEFDDPTRVFISVLSRVIVVTLGLTVFMVDVRLARGKPLTQTLVLLTLLFVVVPSAGLLFIQHALVDLTPTQVLTDLVNTLFATSSDALTLSDRRSLVLAWITHVIIGIGGAIYVHYRFTNIGHSLPDETKEAVEAYASANECSQETALKQLVEAGEESQLSNAVDG